ncbi:MAG: hypothetical protein PHD15_04940 [Clostridia bacterium]|nr:hypothetical protein [Clostridia bacterium]MDD4387086.1 hypothetical protein [Clostridia bacterium]
MLKKAVSVEQLRLMPNRVLFAEQTNATSKLRNLLYELKKENDNRPMKMLIVGAGGSFPSALLVKQILARECKTPEIEVVTPQTAIKMLRQSFFNPINEPFYNVVIAISYSGKTPDIQSVYEVCKAKNIQFILVTKAIISDVEEMYSNYNSIFSNIISYHNENDDTGNERGMISMASTLSPIVIFDNLGSNCKTGNQKYFEKGKEFVETLDIVALAEHIKINPIINVFYEWDTMPTAFDIESKFTEAGIANVILHEKKNFSHGRYVSLYTLKSGLNINLRRLISFVDILNELNEHQNTIYKTPYDEKLEVFLDYISAKNNTPYIKIGTDTYMSSQWNIEAMLIIPYLLVAIGEELGIDISKPLQPFPEEVKELYNYRGKF